MMNSSGAVVGSGKRSVEKVKSLASLASVSRTLNVLGINAFVAKPVFYLRGEHKLWCIRQAYLLTHGPKYTFFCEIFIFQKKKSKILYFCDFFLKIYLDRLNLSRRFRKYGYMIIYLDSVRRYQSPL